MQLKLHMVTIEDLVPADHFLRKLASALDLSFVYEETAHMYCRRYGRPPIDPVVLVKYLLMDLERATLADVLHTMRDATSMHEAARQMGTTLDVAVRDSADALVAQGQLLRDGAWLVEPGAAQARS